MGNLRLYMSNLLPNLIWKVKYGKSLKLDWRQGFGKQTDLIVRGKSNARIGRGTVSRRALSILVADGFFQLGKGCFFNHHCSITCVEQIVIGDGCSFGNNVVIVDHDHNFKKTDDRPFVSSPVILGNNVWVGANCVILKGTTIGDNSVIGAGSIVSGKIGDNVLFYQERTNKMKNIQQ
jgi:acetyltransferase-like isoleucine patch superfamily enzyme